MFGGETFRQLRLFYRAVLIGLVLLLLCNPVVYLLGRQHGYTACKRVAIRQLRPDIPGRPGRCPKDLHGKYWPPRAKWNLCTVKGWVDAR